MSLPTLTGTGRVIAEPEMRFSASGTAVTRIRLAFNSRKKDPSGEWIDADTFFVRGTAFGATAEAIAETLTKGQEIIVTGRMKTEQWEKDGEKRSEAALLIDSIGPNLRKPANGTQPQRGSQQQGGSWGNGPQPAADPWATSAPAGGQGGGYSDEPPF